MKPICTGLQQVISVSRQGQRQGKIINTTTYYMTNETSRAYIHSLIPLEVTVE
ncbi:MAG: hypothetical protein HC877_20080 [Thioploca sp.]|nr:hypothetical protein [Thioploca sp.]